MPRVLYVIDTLGRGGAEQLLATLLPALRGHNVTPIVAVLRPPYDLQDALEKCGIEVIHLPKFHKWNLLRGRTALKMLCADREIDIVHAHLFFPGLYAGFLSVSGSLPTFETFHNLAYAGANKDSLKLRLRKALRKWLSYRSGVNFLAVSEAVSAHYSAELGLNHIATLPNALDLSEIDQAYADAKATAKPNQALAIKVPGRLVAEKGHSDLLAALANAKLASFALEFIGGGPLETALIEQARALGIPVKITGTLPHDQFLQRLAMADICIIPSHYEGFGIAAAEAMALSIPVIATDAGGLPEVVGDAGITVPTGDIYALKEAIMDLAKNGELQAALGIAGSERVRTLFSHENSAAALAKMYIDAILHSTDMSSGNTA